MDFSILAAIPPHQGTHAKAIRAIVWNMHCDNKYSDTEHLFSQQDVFIALWLELAGISVIIDI